MIQATTKMYRDNGNMFFLWVISDDDGVLGHIDGFPTEAHCNDSLIRHLKMWTSGSVCSVNGLLMTVN